MSGTSAKSMLRSPFILIVGTVLTWFIAAFLVWPNLNVLIATFFPDGSFSGRAAEKLFSSQRAMKSLGNSFLLAVALSITVNVVGIFIVLVTHYFKIRAPGSSSWAMPPPSSTAASCWRPGTSSSTGTRESSRPCC